MRLIVPPIDADALRGHDPRAPVVELGGETMGTSWRVRMATTAGVDVPAVDRALREALDGVVAEMSHWDETSLLSRFNRAPAGSWTELPPRFATVMRAALDVARRSGGAFDPAIGVLVDVWGFGPVPVASPPDPPMIAQALATSGWQRLTLDLAAARLRQSGGTRLDLSGIAKGYAVDLLAATLARHGIRHALVEVGGELVGCGLRPDADPWWVELESPAGAAAPIRVALHQCAVATSGDYVRGRHTIDPRTGRPAAHVLSASVLHRSAMLADAWASALCVVDQAEREELATREALAARVLFRQDDAIAEWISPALAAKLVGEEPRRGYTASDADPPRG